MIRFLADEDFKSSILNGVSLRLPDLDIVRVQSVGLRTFADPAILEFAASENRVVLSHDVNTMEIHARTRILAAMSMPGLFLIQQYFPIGKAIDEIVTIAECSHDNEWQNRIGYLPL